MLSICIPIYNVNITNLVQDLAKQVKKETIPFEIILIDDCSLEIFKKQNEAVCVKENYIKLDENIGRAKIRNKFLAYANYDNLLFLDCDSTIIADNYIANYITEIQKKPNYDVFFGGSIYTKKPPIRKKMLRWKYGIQKESQTVENRKKTPNKSFMTNNFLINKRVFKKVRFDERITEYGHEDTLFGYMLKKNKYKVEHIDNAVLNENIEDNNIYLEKTEKSIKNLISIVKYVNHDNELIKNISILNFHKKIETRKLSKTIYILFRLSKSTLKYFFTKGYVNLKLFDFYKLGILITNYKKQKVLNQNSTEKSKLDRVQV